MMIFTTLKSLEDENKMKIDFSIIKKYIKILFVIMIIFTIIYFTFFGCFLVLNDSTSSAAQTVTLSSEGGANEMYPDSMGEYQLVQDDRQGSGVVNDWYRHKDRKDRFLMYNNLGNIEKCCTDYYMLYIY